jgi:hypothetical protein
MRILELSSSVLSFCVMATMLSSCGGAQSSIVAPGSTPQSRAIATHAGSGRSWMPPEAKKIDLLYISNLGRDHVSVFSYPKGKLEGTLRGFSGGECADNAGNVFITNRPEGEVSEFAHGGTSPIATLSDAGELPSGCSVDSTTGNLAVANYCGSDDGQGCSSRGSVSIYTNASGNPTRYTYRLITHLFSCGYDNVGNLFVDGIHTHGSSVFAELPSGGSKFTNITLDQTIEEGGSIQWDGTDLAVGGNESENDAVIYQFTVSGKMGMKVGTTLLSGIKYTPSFWIQPPNVIGANDNYVTGGNVMFWRYPAGGPPTKTIGGLNEPFAATVSLGQIASPAQPAHVGGLPNRVFRNRTVS